MRTAGGNPARLSAPPNFGHSERGPDLADVVVDQRLRGSGEASMWVTLH